MDMSGMDMHNGSHHHAPGSHISFECDGTHFTGMGNQRPSNWSTHVAPGVFLLFWALHWTFGVFRTWFTSSSSHPYRARTTYDIPRIPHSWVIEPGIKILFSFVAIMCQLWWSHGHWSRNICPKGTLRAGHFSITAVHNWQNAWTLFGFLAAGVVDVCARFLPLPANLPHSMTSAAFGLQAFALYQGQHQDMLDAMVYYISFMAATATAVTMLAEMLNPEAFWLGCVKIYTLWMQSIWYFTIARVLFENRPAWDTLKPIPDMSPEMFVPVMFVMWMNVLALGMLIVYVVMRWWYAAHLNEHLRAHCSVERTLHAPGKGAGAATHNGTHEMVPLVTR